MGTESFYAVWFCWKSRKMAYLSERGRQGTISDYVVGRLSEFFALKRFP